jgi:nitrate/nitrite transport system permease protein
MKFQPKKIILDWFLLPLIGFGAVLALWALMAHSVSPDLPTPSQMWEDSKLYVLHPFEKRGELDQGMGLFTWLSLKMVLRGYTCAILVGTPLGFLLGSSKLFSKTFDPLFQVLRPVSPLAWFPLGLVLFGKAHDVSDSAALFTIAMCAMWPTVINTAAGVRAIPQDYLNVAKVLRLSAFQKLTRILIPATIPYMFTGFRLSLGLSWLVIVAVEMLSGRPGVGGFLWQEYQAPMYSHVILCIITIGVVGFILDRLMNVLEKHCLFILSFPSLLRQWAGCVSIGPVREVPNVVS